MVGHRAQQQQCRLPNQHRPAPRVFPRPRPRQAFCTRKLAQTKRKTLKQTRSHRMRPLAKQFLVVPDEDETSEPGDARGVELEERPQLSARALDLSHPAPPCLQLDRILQPPSLFPPFLAFPPRVPENIAVTRQGRRPAEVDSASLLVAKDRDHDRRLHSGSAELVYASH